MTVSEANLRLAGAAWFVLSEANRWEWWCYTLWFSIVLCALELLSTLTMSFGELAYGRTIRVRGKHLDAFSMVDVMCVVFNKCTTPLFSYHLIRAAWHGRFVSWHSPLQLSVVPQWLTQWLVVVPLCYLVYDFFYTLFHRALHHRSLYRFIHKHHHRQKAPSRGNADAVNVHPFEFIVGEYLHLLAVFLVGTFVTPVHFLPLLFFILFGGVLASLNHTRFDIKAPLFPQVYQVKFHDIHHWYPDANFGQYTMFWDRVFGWFKPYPSDKEVVVVASDDADAPSSSHDKAE
jgi:sterol desaturase/sphingolipid hydroxylase (fatty acid hydroxylase superfamily)